MKDYTKDPFFIEYDNMKELFGEPFIDMHPELVAAAVLADKLEAIRVEMTRIRLEMKEK